MRRPASSIKVAVINDRAGREIATATPTCRTAPNRRRRRWRKTASSMDEITSTVAGHTAENAKQANRLADEASAIARAAATRSGQGIDNDVKNQRIRRRSTSSSSTYRVPDEQLALNAAVARAGDQGRLRGRRQRSACSRSVRERGQGDRYPSAIGGRGSMRARARWWRGRTMARSSAA